MISMLMLPASPYFVKTRLTMASGSKRAKRNRLAALGVLSVHALLLGMSWNDQPKGSQRLVHQPTLIQVSALPPSVQSTAGMQPPGRKQLSRPAPAASRPQAAAPTVSSPVRSKAAAQSLPQKPAITSPDASPLADAVTSPQLAAQLLGETTGNPAQSAGPPAGGAQNAGPLASHTAPARIELPDSTADYLDNPRPAYPPMSRRLGEQGKVLLRVWVEADGRPGKIDIRRSSGFDRLDRAALQAVQRWRFVPGKRAGIAEAMWTEIPLQFVLE